MLIKTGGFFSVRDLCSIHGDVGVQGQTDKVGICGDWGLKVGSNIT